MIKKGVKNRSKNGSKNESKKWSKNDPKKCQKGGVKTGPKITPFLGSKMSQNGQKKCAKSWFRVLINAPYFDTFFSIARTHADSERSRFSGGVIFDDFLTHFLDAKKWPKIDPKIDQKSTPFFDQILYPFLHRFLTPFYQFYPPLLLLFFIICTFIHNIY